jgi:hypothetical protein
MWNLDAKRPPARICGNDAERGSILPLGLLSIAMVTSAALIAICASSLFEQQRGLNAIANAVALRVAQTSATFPNAVVNPAEANEMASDELRSIAMGQDSTAVLTSASVIADSNGSFRVAVRVCQSARVGELVVPQLLSGFSFGEVCAAARAGALPDAHFVQ